MLYSLSALLYGYHADMGVQPSAEETHGCNVIKLSNIFVTTSRLRTSITLTCDEGQNRCSCGLGGYVAYRSNTCRLSYNFYSRGG